VRPPEYPPAIPAPPLGRVRAEPDPWFKPDLCPHQGSSGILDRHGDGEHDRPMIVSVIRGDVSPVRLSCARRSHARNSRGCAARGIVPITSTVDAFRRLDGRVRNEIGGAVAAEIASSRWSSRPGVDPANARQLAVASAESNATTETVTRMAVVANHDLAPLVVEALPRAAGAFGMAKA
jgi:hypothetical protein